MNGDFTAASASKRVAEARGYVERLLPLPLTRQQQYCLLSPQIGAFNGSFLPTEGVKVALVGVREGVQVFLSGLDLAVAHAVHHGLEVGSAGGQPAGVGVAEVVDTDGATDPETLTARSQILVRNADRCTAMAEAGRRGWWAGRRYLR